MFKFMKFVSCIAAASLATSGAAAQTGPQDRPGGAGQGGPRPMLFVSPAGLPFRAESEAQTAPPPQRWFSASGQGRREFRNA